MKISAHNPINRYHLLLMNCMVLSFSKVPTCIYNSLILPSIFYRMLFAFVKEQRNNKDNDNLFVTYFIAGLSHPVNGIKVCISYRSNKLIVSLRYTRCNNCNTTHLFIPLVHFSSNQN